jgi:hypothetical protein
MSAAEDAVRSLETISEASAAALSAIVMLNVLVVLPALFVA